jgi:CRP-like cAMP-binding protein
MSLEAEVRSLQQIPMFREMEPARLKLLAFTSERVTLVGDEVFFHQGDPSDAAFVILEGTARVELETPAGRIKLGEIGRNAIVGEMGVITDRPRSATVTALDNVVALRIGRDVFFDILKEFPKLAIAVMRDLADRLEKTNAKLAALAR